MKSYGKLVAALIGGWFLIALTASALHLFVNDSNRVGYTVGLAALAPIVAFSLWFASSPSFRLYTLSLSPVTLTWIQSWRILGFNFVLLHAYGMLPGIFALPAGYGDMAIGATAAFAAWKLADSSHRNGFILWQVLGLADLVMAVSLGTTASLLTPQDPSTGIMTVLPLSLMPTFFVPLLTIFHLICIAQARGWKTSSQTNRTAAGAAA
ncbi:MAG: hypothetical protein ACRD2Q_00610 [Terriglobales bacterium]